MSRLPLLPLALAAALLPGAGNAYDLLTHADISSEAALQSILGDEHRRAQLGILNSIDSTGPAQVFSGTRGEATSILNLIANGSTYEVNRPGFAGGFIL